MNQIIFKFVEDFAPGSKAIKLNKISKLLLG